ncbi:MAG TPA: RluA family pseudouridine synthase [Pyrinomonadaceae bacterium]|nr:RluA family pseudouridine synthase [Pyrinomonadaceae bacterium]
MLKNPVQFRADAADAGQRLDQFLAARLSHLSRMRIARLVAAGACTVNGTAAHAGYRVKTDDALEIAVGDADAPNSTTPERVPLEIVFEDDALVVVVKPSGMLVHPTRGVKSGTLANALAYHLNRRRLANEEHENASLHQQASAASCAETFVRPGLVHRLDRATSGLMVVAKTQRALSILARHFHQRLVEKRYLALVHGRIERDEQLICAPIGRDPEGRPHWSVTETGKPSQTRLRVLERRAHATLVELEPLTGRTNQLRIHCAHLGHAIVGDELYGTAESSVRLCLHASRLAFHHPSSGDWLEFASAPPPELSPDYFSA